MNTQLTLGYEDYGGKSVLIGLSGGINSMAVLCWVCSLPIERRPSVLHLFYADFRSGAMRDLRIMKRSPVMSALLINAKRPERGVFASVYRLAG